MVGEGEGRGVEMQTKKMEKWEKMENGKWKKRRLKAVLV